MSISSVNEALLDRTVRRNILLERYKTHELSEIVTFLNLEVEPDLIARLTQLDLDAVTRGRLLTLRKDVRKIIAESYAEIKNRLQADMLDFARADAAWQLSAITGAIPFSVSLTSPSLAAMREMLRSRPVNGAFISEWFDGLSPVVADRINQQIMLGVVEGEGFDQIVSRIRGTRATQYGDGIIEATRRELDTVVRTVVAGVSSNARQTVFEANTDIVKAVMWVSTLDTRTCEGCGSLEGVTYDVWSGRRPPLHPACRCTISPVVKSWKELGIDLPELPAATRVSMNGQVPRALTFGKWLRAQNAAVQDEVLGKRKGQLFRSGNLTIDRFVDDRSRTLTLDELARRL